MANQFNLDDHDVQISGWRLVLAIPLALLLYGAVFVVWREPRGTWAVVGLALTWFGFYALFKKWWKGALVLLVVGLVFLVVGAVVRG